MFCVVLPTFSLGGVDGGEDVVPGPPGGDGHTLVGLVVAMANSLLILATAGGGRAGGFYSFIDVLPAITSPG